jgi:hypothetical protein
MEAIYHACRIAFNCGGDKVPWHLVCNALRQGCGFDKTVTHWLTEKDYNDYPELRELVENLSCTNSCSKG